jgi:hypothetical protein
MKYGHLQKTDLQESENKVLRTRTEYVKGGVVFRMLCNGEVCDVCRSPVIVWVVKYRKLWWIIYRKLPL